MLNLCNKRTACMQCSPNVLHACNTYAMCNLHMQLLYVACMQCSHKMHAFCAQSMGGSRCNCDNQMVIACLRSRTSKAKGLMHLLRCPVFIEARHGFYIHPMYISSASNHLAPPLVATHSRFCRRYFRPTSSPPQSTSPYFRPSLTREQTGRRARP